MRPRPLTRRRRIASVLLVIGLLASACGGGSEESSGTDVTPLTPQQAVRLAEVLHRNHEAGGARFQLVARDGTSGATITLDGVIDWGSLRGRAAVTGYQDVDGEVTEVAWIADAVAERRPSQLAVLAERGETPDTFFLRPADPQGVVIDRLLAIVVGLATTQPDNAQLVLQNPGAAFVRTDRLREVDVEVLRYSARTIHWVALDTGELLRFEGSDSLGGSPVIVDLLELGPQRVELPAVSVLPLR
jgi:hypothetical protein